MLFPVPPSQQPNRAESHYRQRRRLRHAHGEIEAPAADEAGEHGAVSVPGQRVLAWRQGSKKIERGLRGRYSAKSAVEHVAAPYLVQRYVPDVKHALYEGIHTH